MGKVCSCSPTVIAFAVLAGVFLGVSGTNLFRTHHPSLPSPTAYSAPQLLGSIADSLAVEAYVDSNGRVQDYRVLSATGNLPPQTKNTLIFTTFRPATFMGKTTSGTATLIFTDTNGTITSAPQTQ